MTPSYPRQTEVSPDNNLHILLMEDLPLLPTVVLRGGKYFYGAGGMNAHGIPSQHNLYHNFIPISFHFPSLGGNNTELFDLPFLKNSITCID